MATPVATRTMKAAVIANPQAVRIDEVALPDPGPAQVRVRLEGSGVCGSDIPVWEGREWFDYPREPGAPGHEGWGVVDAVGGAVEGLEPGTRVASLGFHAYAQYDVVDAASVVALPDELDGPFPGEALGCAYNILRRSDLRPGQTVAVVGAGFLGSLLVGLAARAGTNVVAISRRASALDTARAMGAADVIAIDDDPVGRLGATCERVIEAAGKQETLDLAGQLTCERGRLMIAGFHQDSRRSVDMQTWNWRGIDVINAHERDAAVYAEGVAAAAALVAEGELEPAPLYTHRFALEQIDEAFTMAVARPAGFMKALVLA